MLNNVWWGSKLIHWLDKAWLHLQFVMHGYGDCILETEKLETKLESTAYSWYSPRKARPEDISIPKKYNRCRILDNTRLTLWLRYMSWSSSMQTWRISKVWRMLLPIRHCYGIETHLMQHTRESQVSFSALWGSQDYQPCWIEAGCKADAPAHKLWHFCSHMNYSHYGLFIG